MLQVRPAQPCQYIPYAMSEEFGTITKNRSYKIAVITSNRHASEMIDLGGGFSVAPGSLVDKDLIKQLRLD